jgi:hypothetical protein
MHYPRNRRERRQSRRRLIRIVHRGALPSGGATNGGEIEVEGLVRIEDILYFDPSEPERGRTE